jgi:putative Mg2+ transporter-C (MgtC) family protein
MTVLFERRPIVTWLDIWNNYLNVAPGINHIALRLACAMVVGFFIGLEREYTHRPAGLRTHILVALGACVVSITGEILFTQYAALGATPDPARLSAQVITGVGFLGAGTIMREGANVKGLTTAASLWSVACLGIAAGAGYYVVALIGMVLILITLTVFEVIQDKLIGNHVEDCGYTLETENITKALEVISSGAKEYRIDVRELFAEELEVGRHRITFKAEVSGIRANKRRENFFVYIAKHENIKSVCQIKEEV